MSMTAHELARVLLDGPDLPVHFTYTYNDYWRTRVAPQVEQVIDGEVVDSAYHEMDKVAPEDKDGDSGDDYRPAILLS